MVPGFTPDNRDPSRWSHHPVPPEWWEAIREELPAFDPAVTPCREMGAIAETVRTWPGAVRSAHPQTSFIALGGQADLLMAVHPLESELGERSPLAAVEAVHGLVLLLGVGFARCTAFHLAEYRLPHLGRRSNRCVVRSEPDGERHWITYSAATLNDGPFARLGDDYETAFGEEVNIGRVGQSVARLFPIRSAVSFAEQWLKSAEARYQPLSAEKPVSPG